MGTWTRKWTEETLNEYEIPEYDLKSEGGRIPDGCKYGSWLRRHDPTAFNVAHNEYLQEEPHYFAGFTVKEGD
jgi:hypothetical protein